MSGYIALPEPEAFQRVRDAANAACEAAWLKQKFEKWFAGDAINWSNVGCTSVLWCLNESGEHIWCVTIEEAASDAHTFCEWIALHMKEHASIEATVSTEW